MNKLGPPIGCGMTESKTYFAKYLRSCRIETGLSQMKAAKLIGISQSYYSTYERGFYIRISRSRFPDFVRALKCDAKKLSELAPKRKEPETERGKFIRAQREKQHLSIEELARMLGMKPKNLRALETRKNTKMTFETAEQLARAFKLRISVFKDFVDLAWLKPKTKLGRLVRSHRKKLFLSQTKLGKMIGKTRAYISAIESGDVSLRFAQETRRLIAKALKLDPAILDDVTR